MKPGVALDGRWLDGLADRCGPDARQMNSVRTRACGASTENNDRPPQRHPDRDDRVRGQLVSWTRVTTVHLRGDDQRGVLNTRKENLLRRGATSVSRRKSGQ
jgi:hypothetical protein